MVVEMNMAEFYEYMTRAAVLGLFGWVFILQGKVSTFVTQKELHDSLGLLHAELKKIGEDLAYLKGKSGS